MTFTDDELAALEADVQNIGVFFRLDVAPTPIRIWLGFGDIDPGSDIYDPSGALYQGFGELLGTPAISQLLNGAAERVEFKLSGVSGDISAIASGDDAEIVKGRPAAVGFGIFRPDWNLIAGIHWCAYYVADFLSGSNPVVESPGDPIVRTISLSCGTRFTGRRRPSYAYWSNQDQQARFTGDLFCSLTPNYAHGFQKTWPTF